MSRSIFTVFAVDLHDSFSTILVNLFAFKDL